MLSLILRKRFTLYLLAFLLMLSFKAWAVGPADQIRSAVDQVIKILTDPRLSGDAEEERHRLLRETVLPHFDFTEMAKRSLGGHWSRLSQDQQREFVDIFTDLLGHSYVDKIGAYNDEQFVYARESQDKNFAEVDTRIITKKGEEFSINYKLHLVNGHWKVYDLVIENISLVNNYRAQFQRIITNSSHEELLQRIKEKQPETVGETSRRMAP
ncbi:MAG: ABC transporter substrate-binding protein [Deltaproteobacteria bacterium]|nr:ABC transporter substrate-binding protein [Deltaproteobacteria bacterium]